MKKLKLFVAIPTTGTVCDGIMYLMRKLEARYGDDIEFVFPKYCVRRMFHDFARNAMVREFLETDCDMIWFLDSDVLPREDVLDVITIYGDRWMIAGCPYPVFMTAGRDIHQPQDVVFTLYKRLEDGTMVHADCPEKGTDFVDGIATGCLFIKRELLEKMAEPYFDFTFKPDTREIHQGEDIGFCKKVNDMGYKFFIDYSKVCNHFKTVGLLDVNNYAILYARKSLNAYKEAVKQEIAAQIKQKKQPESTLILPNSLKVAGRHG